MPNSQHTPEQKAEAIRLTAEGGLAHAWRETGIPKPTIVRWCKEAGVERFHPEQTRMAVDALQARTAEVRSTLRLMLIEKAVDLIERMDEPHVEFKGKDGAAVEYPIAPAGAVQNYATSAAILIDKFRLEAGEATGRTESWTNDHVDHERGIARAIREELAERARQRAPADAEPAPVGSDRSTGTASPTG